MRNVLLVRYGEVFLKGANRPHFLKVLNDNVKKAVKPIGGKVWMSDSRIYVSDFADLQECIDRVKGFRHSFGQPCGGNGKGSGRDRGKGDRDDARL